MNRAEQLAAVQKEGYELFVKKNTDYGDSFATYGPIGVIVRIGDKIGHHTNNVAEYCGLIVGLRHCIDQKINNVAVYGDSKLIIEQCLNNWKVKNENMQKLHAEVMSLMKSINNISLSHVYRKHNKMADSLANIALDS